MIEQIVERYIALRDQKKVLKDDYEKKVQDIDLGMSRIEAHLMKKMQEQGLKALPTSVGTAYLQTTAKASVADWESVLAFIQENQMWSMLEKRVSKSAVEEFRAANDDLPPGINWSEAVSVNIRRS